MSGHSAAALAVLQAGCVQLSADPAPIFFTKYRGVTFASTCLADPISKQFVAPIGRFAALREVPIVRFEKGQRKDDVARSSWPGSVSPRGST